MVISSAVLSCLGGGGSSKSSAKAAAEANDEHKNFTAEYAKSGQSKCRGCEENIPKVRPLGSVTYGV